MQKRKVILTRNTVLWDAGDRARTFAIVESGKLGVKTGQGLAGIVGPNMVVGESALLSLQGEDPKRTATVFALEDGTTVVEYPPMRVKQALDEQSPRVWRAILTTLLGQIWRNSLLLVSARKENPFFSLPFRTLMQSLAQTYNRQIEILSSWDDFFTTFRYLYETRDYTEAMLGRLIPPGNDAAVIVRASELAQEILKGHGDLPFLGDFLNAEQERNDWLDRFTS